MQKGEGYAALRMNETHNYNNNNLSKWKMNTHHIHIGKALFSHSLIFASAIIICFQTAAAAGVWKEPAEISSVPEECWQLYPFTYSKCIKLCYPDLDATCLDDQLCFCNASTKSHFREVEFSNIMQLKELQKEETSVLPSLNAKFGAHDLATCLYSDFCQDLCDEDQQLATYFPGRVLRGALCKITTIEDRHFNEETTSCICTFE